MLRAEDTCLVLVDIQGKLATLMDRHEVLNENLEKLVKGCQVLGLPIIWNEQLPDKLGPTIEPLKKLLSDQRPLEKSVFSCCGNEQFMQRIKTLRCKQVLLAGIEAHVCVYQTARDLIKEGLEVYLVVDAVSSRTIENKQLALGVMRDLGTKMTGVEMALFEMLVEARGDEFKQVIAIVK